MIKQHPKFQDILSLQPKWEVQFATSLFSNDPVIVLNAWQTLHLFADQPSQPNNNIKVQGQEGMVSGNHCDGKGPRTKKVWKLLLWFFT